MSTADAPSGAIDASYPLYDELRALRAQQRAVNRSTTAEIDGLLSEIAHLKAELGTGKNGTSAERSQSSVEAPATNGHSPGMDEGGVQGIVRSIEALTQGDGAVAKGHKKYHAAISKFGKAIDKLLPGPPAGQGMHRSGDHWDDTAMNAMVLRHLHHQGMFDTATALQQEARLNDDDDDDHAAHAHAHLEGCEAEVEVLREVYSVVAGLRERRLDEAERWVTVQRQQLQKVDSTLPFQLVRLQFLQIVCSKSEEQEAVRLRAFAFAKRSLTAFLTAHCDDINALMTAMLWAGRIEESPYAWMASSALWGEMERAVVADGCKIAGLSPRSHLEVAFQAGMRALPTLAKMRMIVRSSSMDWDTLQELPDHVDLGPGFSYHSIFSCPLSREQSSVANPPVLLKCGHVICKNSMDRIPKIGQSFKCPTCPTRQHTNEAQILWF